jgi:translation initiation factor IF-3
LRRRRQQTPDISAQYRRNRQIRAREVLLIDANNQNVGVVSINKAQDLAREANLDLVEVGPNANPPVCRIMDFSKFIYERKKKERESRKAQTKVEIKEIRLRPKTTSHHRSFKVRDARRWLEEGKKVRVRVRFRGREIHYPEIAREDLDEILAELKDVAMVEQAPLMEGRSMLMILAPAKPKKK